MLKISLQALMNILTSKQYPIIVSRAKHWPADRNILVFYEHLNPVNGHTTPALRYMGDQPEDNNCSIVEKLKNTLPVSLQYDLDNQSIIASNIKWYTKILDAIKETTKKYEKEQQETTLQTAV